MLNPNIIGGLPKQETRRPARSVVSQSKTNTNTRPARSDACFGKK